MSLTSSSNGKVILGGTRAKEVAATKKVLIMMMIRPGRKKERKYESHFPPLQL